MKSYSRDERSKQKSNFSWQEHRTRREDEGVAVEVAKGAKTSKVKCYNCQDFLHYAWECPKKGKEEKALIAEGYASDEPTLL